MRLSVLWFLPFKYLVWLPVMAATFLSAETQAPVLEWSARLNPVLHWIAGAGVLADGSSIVVARTEGSGTPETPRSLNSDIWIAKVSADGAAVLCQAAVGGTGHDSPVAMTTAADGTVLVGGNTASSDFPITPGALQTEFTSGFLMRLDSCGGIRYATYLPVGLAVAAVTAGPDGIAYVAASTTRGNTQILKIDPAGREILGRAEWKGSAGAVELDSYGRVLVAGMRDSKACVTRYSADLSTILFDVTLGDGAMTMATALSVDPDGSSWIASAAVPPGEPLTNQEFRLSHLPFYDRSAVTLTRLNADGTILFHRYVDMADAGITRSYRRPLRVFADPSGRVWLAITGSTGYPRGLPEVGRLAMNSVTLRSFDAAGGPLDGDVVVPIPLDRSLPVVAFGAGGRIVAAAPNAHLPPTPGSVDAGDGSSISVIAFDLRQSAAPGLLQDREALYLDEFSFGNLRHVSNAAAEVASADGRSLSFVAAVVPQAATSSLISDRPPSYFATTDTAGVTPASIHIQRVPGGLGGGMLVVMVPGAQGIVTIPLGTRQYTASLKVRHLERLNLPGPSAEPLTATMRLEVSTPAPSNAQVSVPFEIATTAPWLKLEKRQATTPVEIPFIIDPSGLPSGTHVAALMINAGGVAYSHNLSFVIGPVLIAEDLATTVNVPYGKAQSHTFRLLSSSTPLNFTIEASDSWLQVSPTSGTTPQEITVTVAPTNTPVGATSYSSFVVRFNERSTALRVAYVTTDARSFSLPDRVSPVNLAPGSLFHYEAGTSRCDRSQPETLPWPESLGRCILRVNGRALPLSSILFGRTSSSAYVVFEEIHSIGAQLPYDIDSGNGEIELEDREGRRTRLPIRVAPVVPVLRGISGLSALESPVRRVGEELTFRLSGMGRMNGDARPGDVAREALSPVAPIEVFVGGRRASVVGAELSRSEVGVVELRVQVPPIAADLHVINIRVNGIELPGGWITVTR